jgi:copper(I)-binding protein
VPAGKRVKFTPKSVSMAASPKRNVASCDTIPVCTKGKLSERRRSMRVFIPLLTLLSIASLAGSAVEIQVKDAWIRWLPAGLPGAGYMTVINTGSEERVLVGASTPDYEHVSFHQTRNNNAMNEMAPVASIILKPHATVRFAEGGSHLMLMQPKRSLHPGDTVEVTLRLSTGQTLLVPFDVRAGNDTR